MTHKPVLAAIAFAAIVCSTAPAAADPLGPSSGFIPSYSGTQAPEFAITSGEAFLHGSNFDFDATFGAPIANDVFYVWGVDRGSGLAPFTSNGRPGILFDSVVIFAPSVGPAGTAFVITDLSTNAISFVLSPSEIAVNGDSLRLTVPTSQLPGLGFSDNEYLVSLWTRDGLDPTNFSQIAQFAPSDSVVPVSVPEPAAWMMFLAGLSAIGFAMRSRKRLSAAAAS